MKLWKSALLGGFTGAYLHYCGLGVMTHPVKFLIIVITVAIGYILGALEN